MKSRKLYTLLILQALFIFFACNEDFLIREPIDTIVVGNFYKTSDGIQMAANAIYAPLGEEGFNGKSFWMIGDGASDDAQPNGVDPDYIPIDQFSLASDNPRNADLWQIIYRMIALSNIVLENIEGNDAPEDILHRVEGEALALRGYGYFVLVRLYSDVPKIVEGMLPEELLAPARTSAFDIYKLIISDFERASELLPAKSQYSSYDIGRINRHSVMALLANVYMTLAGDLSMYDTESNPDNSANLRNEFAVNDCYQNALDLCIAVKSSGEYRLMTHFEELWDWVGPESDNNDESIWQLQFLGCGTRHGSGNMRQAFWAPWQSEVTGAGDGWGTHSPHSDLARCFYENPDDLIVVGNGVDTNCVPPADLRFYHTLMFPGVEYPNLPVGEEETPYALPYGYGASGFACKKYVIGKGDGTNVCSMSAPNNVYMIRHAEILLMVAECKVELNQDLPGAAAELDPIRERAGLDPISPSLGQQELRDAVRLERRRELALEQKRWFDILRWGIAYDVLAAQGITLDPERRLFPIPNTEISLNKNLVQNASY